MAQALMTIYDVDDLPEQEWERALGDDPEPTLSELAGQLWAAIVERVKQALRGSNG